MSVSTRADQLDGTCQHVFIIGPDEDKDLIQQWNEKVLPAIPRIMAPYKGNKYLVSLLRQGPDESHAIPFVKIQSSQNRTQHEREAIETEISNLLPGLRFSFSQSSFT